MPMEEARTWPRAPEEEPCTAVTTEPPGRMDLTGDHNYQKAPGSQGSLRRHAPTSQKETHLCSA